MKKHSMHTSVVIFLSIICVSFADAAPLGSERPDTPHSNQDITRLDTRHKLTLESGFGPEFNRIGGERESFYSARYEPTIMGYIPEQRWPRWDFLIRGAFTYDSSLTATALRDDNEVRRIGYSTEMREFYLRRNLINDNPRYSITAGRQGFTDRLGIWWDDSIEAVRFDYNGLISRGFLAAGQKFSYYNSSVNQLDPKDDGVLYVFGKYMWQWKNRHHAGLRLMYERDNSNDMPNPYFSFNGYRVGFSARGEQMNGPLFNDYHVEFASIRGKRDYTSVTMSDTVDINGWALLAEVGSDFENLTWSPRLVIRGGLTDSPEEDATGFYLNRIQSDRINHTNNYSTNLVSSFVRVDMRNLMYASVGVETRPTLRSNLDVRLSNLYLRNIDGPVPIRTNSEQLPTNNDLGQVLDVNYYWRGFPLAMNQRHFSMSTLISASYFRAGSSIGDLDDDYQIVLGLVLRY